MAFDKMIVGPANHHIRLPFVFVGYYFPGHIALYGTSNEFIKAHAAELKPYVQSKGTLQFPADKPLPYELVTKIVEARIAEIDKGR